MVPWRKTGENLLSAAFQKIFKQAFKDIMTITPSTYYRENQKKFTRLAGCDLKSRRPIFKTESLIYQLKANLHEKILFGKITHHFGQEIRKMLVRGMFGNKINRKRKGHDTNVARRIRGCLQ